MPSKTLTSFNLYQEPATTKDGQPIPGRVVAILSTNLDFSVANPYVLDLSELGSRSVNVDVQAIEVNNLNNANLVTLSYNQALQINRQYPGASVEAFTVPLSRNEKFIQLSCAANSGVSQIVIYGYPLPEASTVSLSNSQATLASIAGSTAATSAALPQTAEAEGGAPAGTPARIMSVPLIFNGTTWYFERDGDQLAAGDTAVTLNSVIAGVAGKIPRLFKCQLSLTANATLAAAGVLTIKLKGHTSGALLGQVDVYLPNAVPAGADGLIPLLNLDYGTIGIPAGGAAEAVDLVLSAALATGSLSYNLLYSQGAS